MRFDSVGMFWEDAERVRKSSKAAPRPMPPIPDTGWTPPTYFPNLSAARALSFDVETYDPELHDFGPGWGRKRGHIAGFSVGTPEGYRWYFPIRHTVEPEYNLNPDHALLWLRHTLSDPNQMKVGANLIFDIGWLQEEGIDVRGPLFDVQFAEALLDERAPLALDDLAWRYLGVGKTVDLLRKWIMDYYAPPKDQWRREIYRTPPRLAGPYGEGDADLPLRLAPVLYDKLSREGLLDVFRMECELIPLLVAMRFAAVSVNLSRAEELRETLVKQTEEKQKQLDYNAGFHVEINSAASIKKLFDKFGLKYGLTETGKPSFTKDFLEKVDHPAAKLITEIRKDEKFRSTFVEGYILGSNVNGKIYCSFNPLRGDDGGTRSGRFSSSKPNLQNIPIRDAVLGPLIRSIFVPDYGHKGWRKYDYSQIEYRFLVHYALGPGSDEVRRLFCTDPNTDYHEMIRQLVLKETGTLLDRRPVKNLNFGLVFGMGEAKLARSLNLSASGAKEFMGLYHRGAPFIKPTMRATMDEALRTGIVTTILGRRSRFDLWERDGRDNNAGIALPYEQAILQYGNIRRAYVHKALNRRLQGSAADLMKLAMLNCWKKGIFHETGVPRLTVHDELDFSDPGGKDEAFNEMKREMETAIPIRIPVIAECDEGPDWGACG